MMRRLLLFVGLIAIVVLGGCSAQYQSFSCGPSGGWNRSGDIDLYRRPATTEGTGYLHC